MSYAFQTSFFPCPSMVQSCRGIPLSSALSDYILLWRRPSGIASFARYSGPATETENIERHSATSSRRPTKSSKLNGSYFLAPYEVTQLISQSSSTAQLHSVIMQHKDRLNYIHASAALVRLAKLLTSDAMRNRIKDTHSIVDTLQGDKPSASSSSCLLTVVGVIEGHLDELQPRAVVNSLWAGRFKSSTLAVSVYLNHHF